MNKRYYLLIILLVFFTKANAQFVGYYNLHDGGVDMPSSQLCILPNNEFVLFYYAGYKAGKWKEIDENNIALNESKTMNSPFLIYGLEGKSEKIRINVYGLYRANAFINFSKDTINAKDFQPVFNDGANCLANDYNIEKKNGEYNWLTVSIPNNPEIGKRLFTKYPYKAMSYTFPIEKKYGVYTVLFNEDALNKNMDFTLTKNDKTYSIGGERVLTREELTDEMLKGIEKGKKTVDKEYNFSRYGKPINVSSSKEIITYKPIIKPIFTSICDNDNNENEQKAEKQILKSVNRTNGFYSVENFKEDEYDFEKNILLAKEPSITKNDILSVNKSVSENGGYEIEIIFTEKGSLKFAEFSKNNIRNPVAIVVNKFIVSTLRFYAEITQGKANIEGDFSEDEIDEIIANLKK
jgi:hypothetical protein